MLLPTRKTVRVFILFKLHRVLTLVPYFLEIAPSVSPFCILCYCTSPDTNLFVDSVLLTLVAVLALSGELDATIALLLLFVFL